MAASNSGVYVTDLDGTLLGSDARLSPRTREGLAELLGDGLPLTVASARSVVAIRVVLDGLPIPLPVIEFNGAFVSDLATGRHLVTSALAPDVASKVYGTAVDAGFLPLVSSFDGRSDRLYYSEIRNQGVREYIENRMADGDPRLTRVDDPSAHLTEQVVSLTIIDRPEPVGELHLSLDERFGDVLSMNRFASIYWLGWHWLTVHDARATKDQGVAAMLDLEGLDGATVTALGDGDSDIPLFRASDRGVAVANATEGLLSVATEVIGPSTEDSVVEFLEREWRGSTAG